MAGSTSTAGKGEVRGSPADAVSKEVVRGGVKKIVPLINRGNLKAEPYYWFYKPPTSLFEFDDRLLLICGRNLQKFDGKYSAAIESWCESAQYLCNDLTRILHLKYYKFWSYVLYDDDLQLVIENYLRLCPRWFDLSEFLVTPLMWTLQEQLHDKILKILMRMSTHRESKTDHLTPAKFSEFLLENVYDISRLVDLSVLYGYSDDKPVNPLVRKMILNVFNKQPELTGQVTTLNAAVVQSMVQLADCMVVQDPYSTPGRPSLLAAASLLSELQSLKSSSEQALLDLCQAAVELPVSVLQFVRHAPETVIDQLEEVVRGLPQFFDAVYPALEEELERRKNSMLTVVHEKTREMLAAGQSSSLELFHYYVQKACLDALGKSAGDDGLTLSIIENYYSLVMQAVNEQCFILAYNSIFPLQTDYQVFLKYSHSKYLIDESQFKYIFDSLNVIMTDASLETNVFGEAKAITDEHETEGAVGGKPSSVQYIQEIFPDLSTEFILKCLQFYHDDRDEVTVALMENNLHPELENARYAPSAEPGPVVVSGRDSPEGSVHIGKKKKITNDFLDDRQEKSSLRKVILQHSVIYDEVEITNDKMYDDEYDDTYDSVVSGLPEKGTELEKDFGVPRVLQDNRGGRRKHWEGDEEEEELDEQERRRKQAEFCENPEQVRARREQAHQQRMANRGRPVQPTRNVEGGPRGQGQSSQVLRNRQVKERHKGTNRRSQADYKRREF